MSIQERLLQLEQETYLRRLSGQDIIGNGYRIIDLFAGGGGMTAGFSKFLGHTFNSIWANDFNRYCAETYNENFGDHCVHGDIVDVLKNPKTRIPQAEIVIGGPPCQGFSLLNRNKRNDPRNQLWIPYLDIVQKSKARVFVIENVPHLLGTWEHREIVRRAEEMGFKVWFGKLCAADYGVPQVRWRALIVGSKDVDPKLIFPLRKTHFNPDGADRKNNPEAYMPRPQKWRTVRNAIGNLPSPVGTSIRNVKPPLDLHFGRTPTDMSMERYRAIPKEGMNRFDLQKARPDLTPRCWIMKKSGGTDLFGRQWWNRPSVTIRTEFFKPEKGRYLHPEQHRPITHREAARFQSFPDSFIFKGTKTEIAKQIGNAVAPLFAARIADAVYAMLKVGKKK